MFTAPGEQLLAWQVGIDPLQDYLATSLAPWSAARVGSRRIWRDEDESVTLVYEPAGVGAPALPRPEAELVIVHYTPAERRPVLGPR